LKKIQLYIRQEHVNHQEITEVERPKWDKLKF